MIVRIFTREMVTDEIGLNRTASFKNIEEVMKIEDCGDRWYFEVFNQKEPFYYLKSNLVGLPQIVGNDL